MAGNITVYIAVWCYKHIITYCYIANDYCIDADPNTVSNCRCTLTGASVFLTYQYTFMYIAILAYCHIRINCNIIGMSYI